MIEEVEATKEDRIRLFQVVREYNQIAEIAGIPKVNEYSMWNRHKANLSDLNLAISNLKSTMTKVEKEMKPLMQYRKIMKPLMQYRKIMKPLMQYRKIMEKK